MAEDFEEQIFKQESHIINLKEQIYRTERTIAKMKYDQNKLEQLFDVFCFGCDFKPMELKDIGISDLTFKCSKCKNIVIVKKRENEE